jgi:hypothetical protein
LVVASCLAFAGAANAAGPLAWSGALNVDGTNSIESIDCLSTTFCLAGDLNGQVLASTDPANLSSWVVTALAGAGVMENVSCPSTTLCLAITGTDVWWSTDPTVAAPTWSSATISALQLDSLDCPSVTLCLIGTRSGGTIYSTTTPTNGTSWAPVVVDAARGIFSLDCPTTTFCVAGHDSSATPPGPGVYITTNPTTTVPADWANTDGFNVDAALGGSVIEGLSCVSPSFCAGSDDFGNVMRSANPIGGTTAWATDHLANFPIYWNISCAAPTLCVTGAGTTINTSTDPMTGAASWSTDTVASSILAVSCVTQAFCLVGGGSGNLYVGTQATLNAGVAGLGGGSISGNGIACPPTCSFVYPLNTAVALTATPDSGSVFSGWSGACTGTATCALTMASDRAVTATFDPAPAAVVTSNPTPDPTPAPPVVPPADLPPPVQAQTANAYPTSGTVLVQAPGSKKFVPLTTPQQIRFGGVFDTRHGAVRLVVANGHGGFDTGTFSEGVFKLVQRGKFAELDLFGGSFKGCPKAAKGGAAMIAGATQGRSVRHLWGTGSGSFRTKGRFASATIRGTKWLTDDRCLGTLVRVAVGAVTVRDFVTNKSRALKARKSYFARAA